MTQEDKQLVLVDLCARLPYGVILNVTFKNNYDKIDNRDIELTDGNLTYITRDSHWMTYKPYLRPMSSMTKEEKEKLRQEQIKDEQLFADCIKNHPEMRGLIIPYFAADWCDKNMFDYRTGKDENGNKKTMIELGLALPAPKDMYMEEQ